MFLISSCSCLCSIHWNQVLSRKWRCSCSNYIWVIKWEWFSLIVFMRTANIWVINNFFPTKVHLLLEVLWFADFKTKMLHKLWSYLKWIKKKMPLPLTFPGIQINLLWPLNGSLAVSGKINYHPLRRQANFVTNTEVFSSTIKPLL